MVALLFSHQEAREGFLRYSWYECPADRPTGQVTDNSGVTYAYHFFLDDIANQLLGSSYQLICNSGFYGGHEWEVVIENPDLALLFKLTYGGRLKC